MSVYSIKLKNSLITYALGNLCFIPIKINITYSLMYVYVL